jgi:hypothetical protein
VSTGTRDVDVDLAAARHQLPGAPPSGPLPLFFARKLGSLPVGEDAGV